MSSTKSAAARPVSPVRVVIRIVLGVASTGLLTWGFFAAAGGWDWWPGWAFVALLTVGQTVSAVVVKRRDPELLRRRGEYGEGTKGWDKVVLPLFALTFCAELVIAAFDAGRAWMPLPLWLWPVGAVLYLGGPRFVTRTTMVNPPRATTARPHTDRNHTCTQP